MIYGIYNEVEGHGKVTVGNRTAWIGAQKLPLLQEGIVAIEERESVEFKGTQLNKHTDDPGFFALMIRIMTDQPGLESGSVYQFDENKQSGV